MAPSASILKERTGQAAAAQSSDALTNEMLLKCFPVKLSLEESKLQASSEVSHDFCCLLH